MDVLVVLAAITFFDASYHSYWYEAVPSDRVLEFLMVSVISPGPQLVTASIEPDKLIVPTEILSRIVNSYLPPILSVKTATTLYVPVGTLTTRVVLDTSGEPLPTTEPSDLITLYSPPNCIFFIVSGVVPLLQAANTSIVSPFTVGKLIGDTEIGAEGAVQSFSLQATYTTVTVPVG